MKVLHILNELKHSGAEVMLRQACPVLQRSGIEPHTLSTGSHVGGYASILSQAGWIIHHIPFRKTPAFFVELLTLLRREQFQIVHIHTERSFLWYVFLAKIVGVPTVIRTFHNVFLFSGYLRWKRCVQRWISKSFFRAVHMAISKSVFTVEKELFRNECLVVPNWTDVGLYRPPNTDERAAARTRYGLQPDDVAIATVGACTTVKNHLAIFSALKNANGLMDRGRLIFLHVGTGPLLEEEDLYVRRNGLGPYCRLLGVLEDVRPCLYAADAFVMTSHWEGIGIAAMEAMSTGLPTILYDVYGLRDLVQNGRGGILIDPDEQSLVDALMHVIRTPEWREIKGFECRDLILNNHSLENCVEKLVNLYVGEGRAPAECPVEPGSSVGIIRQSNSS